MHEVPLGPPEQFRRLEQYRQEQPDVDIQPPGADSAVWRAVRDGNLIAYGFTLMVFLERLEVLPEPLGAAQYQRRHARAVHGGNDRRGRRHLPAPPIGSPVGNPVQAGDARGWY